MPCTGAMLTDIQYDHASEMYAMMKRCWLQDVEKRPNFKQIYHALRKFLEKAVTADRMSPVCGTTVLISCTQWKRIQRNRKPKRTASLGSTNSAILEYSLPSTLLRTKMSDLVLPPHVRYLVLWISIDRSGTRDPLSKKQRRWLSRY